jgi:soluble lytic murein transglycosylase
LIVGSLAYLALYTYDFLTRDSNYDYLIEVAAKRHAIDPMLVKAVIWRESGFEPTALGNDGEVGLMQVLPDRTGAAQDWANYTGVKLPCKGVLFNPEMNIEIGTWYLSKYLKKYRDRDNPEVLALCAYNAGPGKAKEWAAIAETKKEPVIKQISYPSTKAYVMAIMDKYLEYSMKREVK